MWFIFTLITIVLWGGADLFYKLGSNEEDKTSHLKIVIFVGLAMGIHALGYMYIFSVDYQWINMLCYLPVSLLYILSMVVGYIGLRYIELSVASPIGNSSGAIAFILCFIFLKEAMTITQIAAVAVISLGIFLLAVIHRKNIDTEQSHGQADESYRRGTLAILFPVLYCIIDGAGTFADALVLDGVMDESQALISYELTFLLAAAAAFIYLTVVRKERIKLSKQKERIFAAVLETAGQFFYVRAMAANAILAAPLVACYSIASIVLSRIFLKERLSLKQYIIIAAVVAAIGILGME